MSYQPKEWSSTTPITVSSLNHIESGISEAHEAISEVNEAITETNSKVEQIAGGQIPEEYVQEAVEEYVNNNSGGFATKTELNTLDSKLSSEIANVTNTLKTAEPTSITNDKYISLSGEMLGTTSSLKVINYEIIPNHKYFVKGDLLIYSQCMFATFYNSKTISPNNKIGEFNYRENTVPFTEIVVPNDAVIMVMTNSINSNVEVYVEDTSDLLPQMELQKLIFNEGYINLNGGIQKTSGYKHSQLIPIKGDIYVDGEMFGASALANIAFYSTPSRMSGFCTGTWKTDTTKYCREKIEIPQNSKYFVVSTQNDIMDFKVYQHVTELKPYTSIQSIISKVIQTSGSQIKLIGDSITHGVGGTGFVNDAEHGDLIYSEGGRSWYVNSTGHCWANSLKSYFEEKFDCTVLNYGTTGRASGNLVEHLADLITERDTIVICMIGTNDRINENDVVSGTKKSKAQLLNNLRTIRDYVKGMGKDIIFMSEIPSSVADEENNRVFHMEDVDHMVMKVCAENNMEYIPLYKLFIEYCESRNITIDSLLSDGLHPNDAGYDVMFYLICNALGIGTKRNGATW